MALSVADALRDATDEELLAEAEDRGILPEIDVADALTAADDEDLLSEVCDRGLEPPLQVDEAFADELRDAVRQNDMRHFELLLMRLTPPSYRCVTRHHAPEQRAA